MVLVMKAKRLLNLTLALLILSSSVFAQSEKIGFVDTSAFTHPQKGITRLIKAMESVEQEFVPRWTEIAGMYARLRKELEKFSYAGPIPTDPRPMTPERKKALKEAAETIQRSIEQREAELQTDYSKRIKEVTAPISQDIRSHLETFAKSRGITMLLDSSKLACVVGCDKEATAAIDVTQEFIAAYNRLNP
jgi:Skp family chaperone for outer membrane proteins